MDMDQCTRQDSWPPQNKAHPQTTFVQRGQVLLARITVPRETVAEAPGARGRLWQTDGTSCLGWNNVGGLREAALATLLQSTTAGQCQRMGT